MLKKLRRKAHRMIHPIANLLVHWMIQSWMLVPRRIWRLDFQMILKNGVKSTNKIVCCAKIPQALLVCGRRHPVPFWTTTIHLLWVNIPDQRILHRSVLLLWLLALIQVNLVNFGDFALSLRLVHGKQVKFQCTLHPIVLVELFLLLRTLLVPVLVKVRLTTS